MRKPRVSTVRPCAPSALPIREGIRFAMPPMDLLTDRMLFPIDRVIAGILAGIAGSSYACWPTNRTLAGMAGCSIKTVYSALHRLERVGWIQVEAAPGRTIRGQVIRLKWSRPGGVGNGLPGGRQSATGGGRQSATDRSRSIEREKKQEASSRPRQEEQTPEDDVLDPEGLEMWRGFAAGGDRVIQKVARGVLAKHERALALAEKTPASGSLGKDTPDAG